jgi:phage tail-like protein
MSLVSGPVLYGLARSGESWPEVTLQGLQSDPGGDLHLRRMPDLSPPWIKTPSDCAPSGLAIDRNCGLYVADTGGDRIVRFGPDCQTELVLPGAQTTCGPGIVQAPAGLCIGSHGWLFVANIDRRVLVFSTPDLTLRDAWPALDRPTDIASYRQAVLVTDSRKLLRFDLRGVPDVGFDAAVRPPAGPYEPRAVAVDCDGVIYVGDGAGRGVLRLTWAGTSAGAPIAPGIWPSALAIDSGTLYVADTYGGHVLLFSLPEGDLIGPVRGFQGPVSALAVGDGALFIKTGSDTGYLRVPLASSYLGRGSLTIGPLDAGKQSAWARAEAKASVPAQTEVEVDWSTADDPSPAAIAWNAAPSLDFLLPGARYLWLRVTLTTRSPVATPILTQVQAQTAGGSYLDHLPYVYANDPDRAGLTSQVLDQADPSDFQPGELAYLRSEYSRSPVEGNVIGRLLDLARSQLGDLELALDGLPAMFDPTTASADLLEWLASWLAFDLPPRLADGRHPDEVRKVLIDLASLYRRRATPSGLADFVEIYSGLRPHVLEEFRRRPLWILDETPLGLGTGMPARDVEGLLVGESITGETGLEDPRTVGAALFSPTAHRFSVVVPPGPGLDDSVRTLIAGVVESEKPAHTAFHLCFAAPRMRVGIQASVGVDAFVALELDEVALDGDYSLDIDARLGGPAPDAPGAVGRHGQLGIDTRLG